MFYSITHVGKKEVANVQERKRFSAECDCPAKTLSIITHLLTKMRNVRDISVLAYVKMLQ